MILHERRYHDGGKGKSASSRLSAAPINYPECRPTDLAQYLQFHLTPPLLCFSLIDYSISQSTMYFILPDRSCKVNTYFDHVSHHMSV